MAATVRKRSSRVSKQNRESEEKIEIVHKNYAYKIKLECEDYLFFASSEKGKVAETAPLLHNYALAFALGLVSSPYYYENQAPQYKELLQPLNQAGIYIFPAVPEQVSHRLMQYNTTDESFLMTRVQSMGYPNWGYIKCIRPGSTFTTYLLSHEPVEIPKRIRLGKWMSQVALDVTELALSQTNAIHTPHLVNIQDVDILPNYFSHLYNLLPTRLVKEAEWKEPIAGYQVEYMDQRLFLPECAFWNKVIT
jgi:CRISPR-associated protein Csc1